MPVKFSEKVPISCNMMLRMSGSQGFTSPPQERDKIGHKLIPISFEVCFSQPIPEVCQEANAMIYVIIYSLYYRRQTSSIATLLKGSITEVA